MRLHEPNELPEQCVHVVRAGACFGMALKTECGAVGTLQPLQGAVEQGAMSGTQRGRQGCLVHRKPMVLGGDHDLATVDVEHRMIGTMVAEFHLQRARAARQPEQLLSQADAEQRHPCLHQLPGGANGVIASRRVAGAVAEHDTVRRHCQRLVRRGCGRNDSDLATEIDELAQDIELGTEVVEDHVPARLGGRGRAVGRLPGTFAPDAGFVRARFTRQIHAVETGKPARTLDCLVGTRITGDDAAVLGAFLAQQAGQAPGIDAGDGDHAAAGQVIRQ